MGYDCAVDDDDDWVGTPPEGHYSADRAQPSFWRAQWQTYAIGAGLLMAIVLVLLVVILTR
ncbi:MAG: hypothetical protein QOE11_288 [Solirubrobacteraceae bacterium]|nr:hypothetical protein [Solirubrobacteraceae bacterium]